ncbi:NAD-dependent epimerase/dehydratase family protein [Mesobacillus jeotgali]|uniref:NAD-dependent epimerase/dehydratase family protein n=1 Tax=Mesobacillus jeotgali TaxID=129985 RepID=UPI000C84D4E9|nr:NAD-dependent epimerase/dehydratase family protein [Mesobacillus jeotgali]
MRKILITGLTSYIGNNLKRFLENYPTKYSIEIISLRDDSWKQIDFSDFDVLVHVAAIAHIKETKANQGIYYRINRDLAYEVAYKAKREGVKQLVFLSSMSVYGIESGVISENTPESPKSNYGKSKLQAEELIQTLKSEDFGVAVIRPPMVYGKDCKGNYQRLAKLALTIPLFPDVKNMRSMIYIDNLCEFIRLLIDECSNGVFFPQNEEYVCTSEMVRLISEAHGKKIRLTKLFNPLFTILKINVVNKVFGNLIYEKHLSKHPLEYNLYPIKESIRKTEVN